MITSVDLCGVRLKNPVIAASGTFAFGKEYEQFYDIRLLGGISVKGLTLAPRMGNPSPRIAETPSGMLNAVGLQNPGVDAFLAEDLPFLRSKDMVVIANIAGSTTQDYIEMAQKVSSAGVDLVELNISCPNVHEGGIAFGTRPESILAITKAVKDVCSCPLMVKLSPNVASISECALAAEQGGADALSLINTLVGMAVDVHKKRSILANVTGGLSGPAIRPVALRMAYEVARAVSIPVVGMGGIETGEDAIAFLLVGCVAVQVGSANLYDPYACTKVIYGIEEYMQKHNIADVRDLVGALES